MKLQFQPPALGAPSHLLVWYALLAPNNLSLSNLDSNSRSNPTQTTIEPIPPALRLAPPPIPEAFLITPTPLNLHKRFRPAASFKQLYRMRPVVSGR